MNKPINCHQATYGFISVREFEGVGYCGGLLIVTHLGRPLEFHCSTPILPNRAQQILYGQTYPTYLFCEQIGLALIDKAKTVPNLLLANSEHLLALNSMTSVPIVALADESDKSPDEGADEGAGERRGFRQFESISMGQQKLWYQSSNAQDREQRLPAITSLLDRFTKSLTLDEPFERIEKAIEEAQAVAR